MATHEQEAAYQEYLSSLTDGKKMFRVRDLLQMRPTFQRPLSKSHVAKITREWQVHRFGEPVVCIDPDGVHLLDDGQHRVVAAGHKFGLDAELQCRVVHTNTPGAEFVALNTDRKAVSAYHKFTALISDGDATALSINAMVSRHGLTITRGGTEPMSVSCVNTIIDLYSRDARTLDRALSVLASVVKVRENEGGWLKANVVQAVWYVIRMYPCEDKVMVRNLAKTTPERVAPHNANDPTRNAGDVIIAYNKNLPNAKRISIAHPYPDK